MNRVIVTGANGFVGSAVVKELSNRGVQVWAVVRDETSDIASIADLPNVHIVYCELSEMEQLPQKISEREFEVFYHFAWAGSAGEKRGDIALQIKNVQSSCAAVRVSAELNCSKFVFAASIMQYEALAIKQTDKNMPLSSVYCTAKIAADGMGRSIADSLDMHYISAIISNIYGPGETSPRLINTSIRKLRAGMHTSFSAGEQLYDFIYIDDAAKMFAVIGAHEAKRKSYYIGNRSPRQLKEFLLEMRDVVSPAAKLGLGELPFEGVSLTYREFDTAAVYEDTGCEPEVPFREGIQRTSAWIHDSLEGG